MKKGRFENGPFGDLRLSSVSTEDMSSLAREDMSCLEREDMSCLAREDMSCLSRKGAKLSKFMKNGPKWV